MSQLVSLETEQATLGALLNDSDAFDRVGSLQPSDFSNEQHRIVFSTIQDLLASNKPSDVITVFENSKKRGVDIEYLNHLSQISHSSSRVATHANILRDVALRRKVVTIGKQFEEIAESALNFDECLELVSKEFESLTTQSKASDPVSASDLMGGIYQTMNDRMRGTVKKISTGFKDLDNKLGGGFDKGDLVIIAGRPSMGKTSFAMSIAENTSKELSTVIFSMEMPKSQLRDRLTSQIGKVPLSFVLQPYEDESTGNQDDWTRVVKAQEEASKLNLFIDDKSSLTLNEIRIKARNIKRKHGLDVIIIDYLQLLSSSGKPENRTQEVGAFSRGLKSIAKDLGVAVICLSQLNRGLEQRTNKRPIMSDLRESGEIEQDADTIMFIYRDEVYDPSSLQKGVAEIIVAKQRQGSIGSVGMAFIADQVRFDQLAYRWTPPESMKKAQEYKNKRGLD